MSPLTIFLLPLREKVDRAARRMRGLPKSNAESGSTTPLIRQPRRLQVTCDAATFSRKGRREC
jgi:hypothetical protein